MDFTGWIGVGREDITPPVGIYARNWGAATHDVAEGIHRPLNVTAVSLQSRPGDTSYLLVAADAGWWRTAEDEQFVRNGVLSALQVAPHQMMICLSHTHAGPSLCREDVDKPGGHLIPAYLEKFREAITTASRQALASAQQATLSWGKGTCHLATNRDLADPGGTRYLCGYNAALPAESQVSVGRITSQAGRPLATLVHYACHPTTLAWQNRLISPDYIGALREVVEAHTQNAPCLYLHGASGELAPRYQYTPDTSVPDSHGRQLGYTVLATLEGMLPPNSRLLYSGFVESGAPLAIWNHIPQAASSHLSGIVQEVELPLQPLPSLSELEAQIARCPDRALQERLVRKRRIRKSIGDGDTANIPLWVWRIGDSFLVGQPNEAYSWLQTELRQRFPDNPVLVMNVVNGHFGYLPPESFYNRDIYPVWQTPFGPGSLERTLGASILAIEQLLESAP